MIVILATTAFAWTQQQTSSGIPVKWTDTAIDFRMDFDSEPFAGASEVVRQGFAEWEDISNDTIRFYGGRATDRARDEKNGINEVGFLAEWDYSPTTLAVTRIWVNSIGEIEEFDLLLQANPPNGWGEGTLQVDLLSTVRHEVGHALGLGHSDVREAVMYDSVKPGEHRILHSDDIDAIRTIYLGDKEPDQEETGCHHTENFPFWWAAILAFRNKGVDNEVD